MPFLNELFPKAISLNAIGGPSFEVDIAGNQAGNEWRNLITSMSRFEYEVSHAARLPAVWKPLQKFFMNMHAQYYSFRFYDHLDHLADDDEGVFMLAPGSPVQYQMYKKYQFGNQTYLRRITKPIEDAIVMPGSGFTVDYNTGLVTASGSAPTVWYGEFHVHARFNTRQMRAETINISKDGQYIVGWSSIPIVEVKTAD